MSDDVGNKINLVSKKGKGSIFYFVIDNKGSEQPGEESISDKELFH